MDPAKQRALTACGTCGHQEWEHQGSVGEGEQLDVLAALGGACRHFTVSDAALAYARHLEIANKRPGKTPGPRCERCGNRGHQKKDCVL
jgi:hypothetical protein